MLSPFFHLNWIIRPKKRRIERYDLKRDQSEHYYDIIWHVQLLILLPLPVKRFSSKPGLVLFLIQAQFIFSPKWAISNENILWTLIRTM